MTFQQMDSIPSFSRLLYRSTANVSRFAIDGAVIVAGILCFVATKADLGAGIFQVPAVEQARIASALLKEAVMNKNGD